MNDVITIKRITPRGTGLMIARAIECIPQAEGRRYRMAQLLGTNQANIANWLYGTPVDPRYCVAIEQLTRGKVRAHQLRPDVFPAPHNAFPIHPNADKGMSYAKELTQRKRASW
jgi:DNA-binding transcriptional regulator YdaS (Cro superfamily)